MSTAVPRSDAGARALWSSSCAISGSPARSTHPSGVQVWLLWYGDQLFKGQYCQIGKSRLIMQTDGNLVLYDENSRARWSTNTVGRGNRAIMQSDGNFVVYDSANRAVWDSRTCCHSSSYLAVQSDGNVVIYDSRWGVRWATNTWH